MCACGAPNAGRTCATQTPAQHPTAAQPCGRRYSRVCLPRVRGASTTPCNNDAASTAARALTCVVGHLDVGPDHLDEQRGLNERLTPGQEDLLRVRGTRVATCGMYGPSLRMKPRLVTISTYSYEANCRGAIPPPGHALAFSRQRGRRGRPRWLPSWCEMHHSATSHYTLYVGQTKCCSDTPGR